MNLGAFMDPEFPIFSTTLCYLEREDAYLMLHRIKKQDVLERNISSLFLYLLYFPIVVLLS